MARGKKWSDEKRAAVMAGFPGARHKSRYAARMGVSVSTIHKWASSARRAAGAPAPRPPGRPRGRPRAETLPPPLAFDPGDWPAILAAYETVGALIAGMPPAIADAVLRTHLHRLHIPGLNARPVVRAEVEGAAE